MKLHPPMSRTNAQVCIGVELILWIATADLSFLDDDLHWSHPRTISFTFLLPDHHPITSVIHLSVRSTTMNNCTAQCLIVVDLCNRFPCCFTSGHVLPKSGTVRQIEQRNGMCEKLWDWMLLIQELELPCQTLTSQEDILDAYSIGSLYLLHG